MWIRERCVERGVELRGGGGVASVDVDQRRERKRNGGGYFKYGSFPSFSGKGELVESSVLWLLR